MRGVLTADRIEGRYRFRRTPDRDTCRGAVSGSEIHEPESSRDLLTPQVDKAILGPTPMDAAGKDPNSDPYLDEWLTSERFSET